MVNNLAKDAPFFIVGCPRSGTSLLLLLLNAHPRIAIPLESHIFPRFFFWLPLYGNLSKHDNLKKLAKDILGDIWIRQWDLDVSDEEFCQGVNENSFRGCVDRLYNLYTKIQGKQRWGDKTPSHVYYIRQIKEIFPEALFINIVRDGRDVVKSLKKIWFAPYNVYDNAILWKNHISEFQRAKQYLQESDYIEVSYESLVCNTDKELMRIFSLLGEEAILSEGKVPSSKLLKYFNHNSNSHKLLFGPITDSQIGSFRHELNQRQIELIETIVSAELQSYGYALDTRAGAVMNIIDKVVVFLSRCYSKQKKLQYTTYRVGKFQLKKRRLMLFLYSMLRKAGSNQ